MNILNIEHVCKHFGERTIFDDISYGIHSHDKIGIIGINGTGKTTLLRILAGDEEPDEGQVIRGNGIRLAYLPQNPKFPKGATVLSYVAEGSEEQEWKAGSDAKTILNKLGLSEFDAPIETLSGGQKKRVALARTILNPADILVLDEPTNHIDNQMAQWLEEFLIAYKGAVVMVTHDRYFLDRVTNKILEISHGRLYAYEAKYSKFLEMKAEREAMERASERKRQSILRMELEWAARGCRARTTKQQARLDRLEALKNGKAPIVDEKVELQSVETRMGKKTIELSHVSKSYGDKQLIDDFNYIVLKNQRLGIIGPNGCGKSTLLRMIAGVERPDSGDIVIGDTIRLGYFAQHNVDMDDHQRVIDYIREVADYVPTKDGKISASQLLERFLFDSNLQYTLLGKLSGGEKRRLYLCRVLMGAPNVLLLDECTNDLDIPTLTILEDYLDSFAGIVIAVSHDRYFLDNLADRIFAFEGDGKLRQYEGGYTDYLEAVSRQVVAEPVQKQEKKADAKSWKQNQPTKLKFSYKEQREFDTIEDDIEALEESIVTLDAEMVKYATNSAKLSELLKEKEEKEELLAEKMERWVYLNDLAERIAQESK